jgi:hypothetical protein
LQFGPDDVFLFEDWEETPVGPYRALFHLSRDDFRTLYVDGEEGKNVVCGIHRFDTTYVTEISSRRDSGVWIIDTDTKDRGFLNMEVSFEATTVLKAINRLAPHVPEVVARNPLYCKLLPRLASPIMGTDPDFKIAGLTEMGRKVRFRLDRIYSVTGGRCIWDGLDLGTLRDCSFRHDLGDMRPVNKPMALYLSLCVD